MVYVRINHDGSLLTCAIHTMVEALQIVRLVAMHPEVGEVSIQDGEEVWKTIAKERGIEIVRVRDKI